ncbi:MAG: OmpA family protein, partial [Chitinophagaceae bacterium]|nr:OmpA family protein [Rubrivivax sp.]
NAAQSAQTAAAAQQRAGMAESQAATSAAAAAATQQRNDQLQQQTAMLQRELEAMNAKKTERGMLVTLGDVLFEFGRAEIKPTSMESLRKLADFLKQNPERNVLIEGFTDSIGSASSNDVLSRRRAEAVANALSGLGVPAAKIRSTGYGKEYPIADNSTDSNRALNRRVEVYISDNDQPVQPRRG